MRKLDRSQPVQQTFGADAVTYPFFQDGLYFNHQGDLMDIPHNRSTYTTRGLNIDDDLVVITPAPTPAGTAAPDDFLAGKSAAEVFGIAERLRAQLDISEDADNYVPTVPAYADNVEFIRRHAE